LHAKKDLDFDEVNDPPARELELAKELLDHVIATERTDKKRIYIMGYSMGGFGTFELITRWPDTFAAAVAICGGGNVERTRDYAKKVSVWITHGLNDNIVNPLFSRRVYEALKLQDADVKYTEFSKANHNAWDPTFEMPGLLPWLFSRKK
jgi:predicted peptidase